MVDVPQQSYGTRGSGESKINLAEGTPSFWAYCPPDDEAHYLSPALSRLNDIKPNDFRWATGGTLLVQA